MNVIPLPEDPQNILMAGINYELGSWLIDVKYCSFPVLVKLNNSDGNGKLSQLSQLDISRNRRALLLFLSPVVTGCTTLGLNLPSDRNISHRWRAGKVLSTSAQTQSGGIVPDLS